MKPTTISVAQERILKNLYQGYPYDFHVGSISEMDHCRIRVSLQVLIRKNVVEVTEDGLKLTPLGQSMAIDRWGLKRGFINDNE